MTSDEYFEIVKRWEDQYGLPKKMRFSYDPTLVNACCLKCGEMKSKTSRHHKSNDFFFALWFPDWYAARYIQFLPTDCARLCDVCHGKIERYSVKLKKRLYVEFQFHKHKSNWNDTRWREWCEEWRKRFTDLFTRWIGIPQHHRRKRRKRRLPTKHEDHNGSTIEGS